MKAILATALAALALPLPARAEQPAPIRIVAAENVYGDVARQLAGPRAVVTSVLRNPDEDPHLFEASPSVARALADARIAIANGAAYDPWMRKLLSVSRSADRRTIVVADLVHARPGGNPHLWYDPGTMPVFAHALAADLEGADPAHTADYQRRLRAFMESLTPVEARIAGLRRKYAGTPVTATEPVFGYMAAALGLVMRNEGFQRAVMNGTEPSASAVAGFESDLRNHRVKLLIHNTQATDTMAERLVRIAKDAHVPTVGVTETEPASTTYQAWMLGQLDALDRALSASPS